MVVFPNAKINLGLFVTGKRSDGYHNIESVFCPLPWCEALEAVPMPAEGRNCRETIRLFLYGDGIPGRREENLVLKTVEHLRSVRTLPPLDIHLLKKLPMGAGLGGGSADAAFALRALNSFLDEPLSDGEARVMLEKVGSDCPFFWENRPMYVSGRGEVMEPIDLDLSGYWFLVVNPGIHIATKEAYAGISTDSGPSIDLRSLGSIPVVEWKDHLVNAFEEGIFQSHPIIGEVKNRMYELGAVYASMTGSGSSVYGIFPEKPGIPPEWLRGQHWCGKAQ